MNDTQALIILTKALMKIQKAHDKIIEQYYGTSRRMDTEAMTDHIISLKKMTDNALNKAALCTTQKPKSN